MKCLRDPESFRAYDRDWRPTLVSEQRGFGLTDLLEHAVR
jgi:hypothetical protein